jgi:hypothetical protein
LFCADFAGARCRPSRADRGRKKKRREKEKRTSLFHEILTSNPGDTTKDT